ncbi:MAG: hypothetical protein DRP93_01260 [Candidatus Neomarinimicrobiota bacterium]|nr:MAG: hypothetical protein DRP93_01260 [Candidatus Neomarinimicrobiota bacterium]
MLTKENIDIVFQKYDSLPFWKSPYSRLIALLQLSRGDKYWYYTHVELTMINNGKRTFIGARAPDGITVVPEGDKLVDNEWHVPKLKSDIDTMVIYHWLFKHVGTKYDWYAIFFSQALSLNEEDEKKYYCSEAIAEGLSLKNTRRRPSQIYEIVADV